MNTNMTLELEVDKKKVNWRGLGLKLAMTIAMILLSLLLDLDWKIRYSAFLAGLFWCIFSFPQKWRRLLFTLYLIFAIGVVTSGRIHAFVATNKKMSKLISNPTWQDALSFVTGIMIGSFAVGLPLFTVLFVSSEYVLALHAIAGVSRKDALHLLGGLVMGIHLPWLIVEDGEVTESKPKGVLPEVGGPGVVVIRPGNVVVFERHGEVTRIAGPGLVKTKRFEKIRGIIDLRPQWATFEADNVLTKDRVPLTIKYGVGYQIEPSSDTDERLESVLEGDGEALTEEIGGVYPVYAATVRKAVFNVTPAGWQLTVRMAAGSFLRDTVATLDFDEIFELTEDARERIIENRRRLYEIEQRVQDKLTQAALNWGIKIRTFDVESIEIPLDWWQTEWQTRAVMRLADGERDALMAKADGRARALREVERVKTAAVRAAVSEIVGSVRQMCEVMTDKGVGGKELGEFVERFIEVVNHLACSLVADDITALRRIEMLEKIAESRGEVTLIIGGEETTRLYLPPY